MQTSPRRSLGEGGFVNGVDDLFAGKHGENYPRLFGCKPRRAVASAKAGSLMALMTFLLVSMAKTTADYPPSSSDYGVADADANG
jgi:hypothetical protein